MYDLFILNHLFTASAFDERWVTDLSRACPWVTRTKPELFIVPWQFPPRGGHNWVVKHRHGVITERKIVSIVCSHCADGGESPPTVALRRNHRYRVGLSDYTLVWLQRLIHRVESEVHSLSYRQSINRSRRTLINFFVFLLNKPTS